MQIEKMEIDYTGIVEPAGPSEGADWDPPVHKFFGKRLPNGKTEKEPVYVHQSFPSLRYADKNGKIVARIVRTAEEAAGLGPGWSDTPATFGYIGAPSHEQHLAMTGSAAAQDEVIATMLPRRGRPPKAQEAA